MPARLGGEEFAVLRPRATGQQAAGVAEQLRGIVEALACEPADDAAARGTIRFTASFGVARVVAG